MDKIELLKLTKDLTGQNTINELIKQSEILHKYLLSDAEFIARVKELTIFQNFISEFSIKSNINDEFCRIKYMDYYSEIIKLLDNNRLVSVSNRRRQGITTFIILYALFIACTQSNKTIVISSINERSISNIRNELNEIYSSRDDSNLFPGIIKCNKATMTFDNGSKILLRRCVDKNFLRGLSVNFLLMDMTNYVPYKMSDLILSCMMPSFSTSGKILCCSDNEMSITQNSLFYKLKNLSKFIDITQI